MEGAAGRGLLAVWLVLPLTVEVGERVQGFLLNNSTRHGSVDFFEAQNGQQCSSVDDRSKALPPAQALIAEVNGEESPALFTASGRLKRSWRILLQADPASQDVYNQLINHTPFLFFLCLPFLERDAFLGLMDPRVQAYARHRGLESFQINTRVQDCLYLAYENIRFHLKKEALPWVKAALAVSSSEVARGLLYRLRYTAMEGTRNSSVVEPKILFTPSRGDMNMDL